MNLAKIKKQSRFSVAPMMDWTDRHCRYFHRLLAPNVRLYTEMVTTGAILHGDHYRFLRHHDAEAPVALQLGGSTPEDLEKCSSLAVQDYGYDEINLNCGCPSDRVQNGRFGACLMKEPDHVARCFEAMQKGAAQNQSRDIPVTIKCRIGVDDQDDEKFIHSFIQTLSTAGCRIFIIHARKAFLKGLSPKENRDVPPLRYDVAASVKDAFPDHLIVLNGGIKTVTDTLGHLSHFDGVMIGREAYQNPLILRALQEQLYPDTKTSLLSIEDVINHMAEYIDTSMPKDDGLQAKNITRHMLGLFQGQAGARKWRRFLSTEAFKQGTTGDILLQAFDLIKAEQAKQLEMDETQNSFFA
jgi:tRNA-dihydrouridine synthase A